MNLSKRYAAFEWRECVMCGVRFHESKSVKRNKCFDCIRLCKTTTHFLNKKRANMKAPTHRPDPTNPLFCTECEEAIENVEHQQCTEAK